MPQAVNPQKENKIMGDKSPKSNQKKSSQKQSKASSADQKKAPPSPQNPPQARKNNRRLFAVVLGLEIRGDRFFLQTSRGDYGVFTSRFFRKLT